MSVTVANGSFGTRCLCGTSVVAACELDATGGRVPAEFFVVHGIVVCGKQASCGVDGFVRIGDWLGGPVHHGSLV